MRMSVAAATAIMLIQAAAPRAIAQHQSPVTVPIGHAGYEVRPFRYPTPPHPLKRLFHEIAKPLHALTGGLVGTGSHGHPSPEEMQYLLDGGNLDVTPAQAVAAKISLVEAWAPERRAAVRYLGTVDLHRYPEAEMALIAALREDPSECVRLEAALALGRTNFCTKQTLAALLLTVSGATEDGCCAERSPHVRAAAINALNRHMQYFESLPPEQSPQIEPLTVPPNPVENDSEATGGNLRYISYYTVKVGATPRQALLQKAGRLLASLAGKGQRPAPHPGLLATMHATSSYREPPKEIIPFDEAALATPVHATGVRFGSQKGGTFGSKITDARQNREGELSAPKAPVPWPGSDSERNASRKRLLLPIFGFGSSQRQLTRKTEPTAATPKDDARSSSDATHRRSDRKEPSGQPIRLPDLESRLPRSRTDAPALGGFALPVSRSSFTGMTGIVSRRATGIDIAD